MIFFADHESQERTEPLALLDAQAAFALVGLPALTTPWSPSALSGSFQSNSSTDLITSH
jgi:hypothetical protein